MSTMIKINEGIERNKSLGENDIYRKFNKQFEKLFIAKESVKSKEEFESIYVNDGEFEIKINDFRNAETNTIRFCVGYTGIGKTTLIRHCFELGASNEPYINEKKKEVIFPSFLDGYQEKDMDNFDLSIRISAVCTKLENLYPDLKSLMRTYEGKKEFHDFIEKHTGYILENVNPVKAMDMEDNELIVEKLDAAYTKHPFEFQANKLKFYLKKKYDLFDRLIIILDDIESLSENTQIEIIGKYLKLHECMQNTDFPNEKEYNVKILISVRPQTYRNVRWDSKIEAFPIGEYPILKRRAVSLDNIFEKRFRHYTKEYANPIGNQETWDACYKELEKMNNAFEGQYKDMISNLCLMNIRESLASYSKVFANRFWVQRNKPKEEHFTVIEKEYSFNNINVIRALACHEEKVFWGDGETIIPNIFLTEKEDDLSIYCLLVMSYFVNTRSAEYGINAEKWKDVKEKWRKIVGSDVLLKLIRTTEFLYTQEILSRSVMDCDDNNTEKIITDENCLYISPRGNEMFSMLSRDSVLLEMLRENVWRDYDDRNYSDQCSSDLMKMGKQDEIFKDLLAYIDYLYDIESSVKAIVRILHTENEYKNNFGTTPVSYILLKGVKNSMDYSGYINMVFEQYNSLRSKILN